MQILKVFCPDCGAMTVIEINYETKRATIIECIHDPITINAPKAK